MPSSDHDYDSDSDVSSETSTVVYDHEPFETYQTRVRNLLCILYGPDTGRAAEITRLSGGGFNRIIGATLPTNSAAPFADLILRVPRFSSAEVATQVGLLRALHASLPVPTVEHYDTGMDNALGEPYVLLRRLPGQNLHDVLLDMEFDERCDVAKQVARLIAKIHNVILPPGIGPLAGDGEGKLRIRRFPDGSLGSEDMPPTEHPSDAGDTRGRAPLPTTFPEFVTTRLAELKAHALHQGPAHAFRVELCDELLEASKNLLPTFALSGRVALFHRDFAARNILVDRTLHGNGWTITGVLDWDDCEAAPLEIAAVWPGWLWSSKDEEEADFDENEWDPDLPVPNEECERIKRAFVEEIEELEPGFQEMARRTRDGCLRSLYERARGGFLSNEHMEGVDRVVGAAQRLAELDARRRLQVVKKASCAKLSACSITSKDGHSRKGTFTPQLYAPAAIVVSER
ncbi:hypothetical protein FRC08_009174 [Ceratobasidium sp. 394]|nr:hypothetical protein FRC08_009174 [Ceratobasidium sp. 394]KAG9083751.1 hypothetical protein FS749_005757 [Ceratobasidium sp. UAMH 11750]